MNKKEREGILHALILLKRNNHLSAHRAGLEERQCNRKAAMEILIGLVDLSEEELEELYWK